MLFLLTIVNVLTILCCKARLLIKMLWEELCNNVLSLTSDPCSDNGLDTQGGGGGNLKKSEQGGSVYFFGSEIWLKFTFLGEEKYNYFFGLQIFEINFLGSLKVANFFFLGGGRMLTCSRYRLRYFFVHNLFKKKDGSTRYTHIKVGQREGYFINSINGGGEEMYTDQICNMTDF